MFTQSKMLQISRTRKRITKRTTKAKNRIIFAPKLRRLPVIHGFLRWNYVNIFDSAFYYVFVMAADDMQAVETFADLMPM